MSPNPVTPLNSIDTVLYLKASTKLEDEVSKELAENETELEKTAAELINEHRPSSL